MVDLEQLCMGCMEVKGTPEVCPYCGYVEGTPPASPLHLMPRTEVHGQYVIGRVLGHGGFGITYLGWDLNLERKIAIKEYLPGGVAIRDGVNPQVLPFSGDLKKDYEYGLERFLDEARTVARFQTHPSIVSVLNFFRANGTAYLVMEYLEGVTLEQYLDAQGGKVGAEVAVRVVVPVLEALEAVHKEGILHRDVSPDNVFVTKGWAVKVLDFGAARYALGQKSRNLSVILKEGYAPVEQYHSKGNQGPWTDVYSAAATFYRAVTGQIPPAALDRMQTDEMAAPSAAGAELSTEVERAVMKALAVSPEHRFHTVEAFREALLGLRPVEEWTAPQPPAPQPLTASGQHPASAYAVTVRSTQLESTGGQASVAAAEVKKPMPKWMWGAGAAVVVLVIGWGAWNSAEDRKRAAATAQQNAAAQARLDEEIRRQKDLDASFEKRRQERQGELEELRKQEEALEEQKKVLAQQQEALKRSGNAPAAARQMAENAKKQQALDAQKQEIDRLRKLAQSRVVAVAPAATGNQLNSATAAPSYEDLLARAAAESKARNYAAAIQANQQAVQMNGGRPDAYANLGWLHLYGVVDTAAALKEYEAALQRGGTVYFRVKHGHEGTSYENACEGNLGFSAKGVEFAPAPALHQFKLEAGQVKEVKENRNPFRGTSGDFHLKTSDNRNFNFLPVTNAKAVRDVILQIAKPR